MNKALFVCLPSDIVQCILYEWITFHELVQVDIACLNHHQRTLYYQALQLSSQPLIQSTITIEHISSDQLLPSLLHWSKTRRIQNPIRALILFDIESSQRPSTYQIEELPHLQSLSIVYANNIQLHCISKLLSLQQLTLESISLMESSSTPSLFISFQYFFQQNIHLKTLILQDCFFQPSFFQSVSLSSSLLTLHLFELSDLSKDHLQAIGSLPQLQTLLLSNIYATSASDYEMLGQLPQLIRLKLYYCNINNQGLLGLCQQIKHLRCLLIMGCHSLDFSTSSSFHGFRLLFELRRLTINTMHLDNIILQDILQLTQLTHLSLTHISPSTSTQTISLSLFHQLSSFSYLQELQLHDIIFDLTNNANKWLILCLIRHKITLIKVEISNCLDFELNDLKPLQQLCHLQELIVSSSTIELKSLQSVFSFVSKVKLIPL